VNQTNGKRLLSAGEAAQLLEVSTDTIKRWATDGQLPYITTPGGHRRFPAEAVHRLLAEQQAQAEQELTAWLRRTGRR
jgi:excisionase family DNA binding protein